MTPDEVRKLTPAERLLYWIREREAVRLGKEAGLPPPWTDDPILQSWRFCNVRRMDDHVSRWLLDSWYRPYLGHTNMLYAAALARFFNLPRTLLMIESSVFRVGLPDWGEIKRAVRHAKGRGGGPVFNAAYMVRGNDGSDKVTSVVDFNVRPLAKDPPVVDPSSMRNTWAALACRYGFGSFMAGQVVADLRWAVPGTWADRDVWAPLGPGSRRGLNRLLGRDPNTPVSQREFVRELHTLIRLCYAGLPAPVVTRLEAIDFQNCLCEFDGYEKVLWGQGRKKRTYPGRG